MREEAGCRPVMLRPAGRRLIEYLRRVKEGKLKLKVQDGLPVAAERLIGEVSFGEGPARAPSGYSG